MADKRKSVQIKTVEEAVFCIQAGHQIYNGSFCLPAGYFKRWTLARLFAAVRKGSLWLPEPGASV